MARKRRKNGLALPVGILTVILAVVGLVTVVHACVNLVQAKTDKAAEKAEYEELLKPVVMFDPDPFDDLSQADKSQLLYAAIWNILQDENGMSKYSYYNQGDVFGIQVPQADIEASFTELFGTEIDASTLHSTVDMSSYDITYESALQSYILPITGVDSTYTPKVYTIDKQGTSVVLNVGYIGNQAWASLDDEGKLTTPEPDKYMKITLRERDGGMYVASIQEADGQEIAEVLTTTAVYTDETEQISETEIETEVTDETTVQYETVTDENGEAVTDESGETVTEAVTASEGESTDESSDESTEETAEYEENI